MSLSTLMETTDRGLDMCIKRTGRLLSVRWWCLASGGGYPEVQALRLVFKVSLSELARANGCHLPEDNHKLAKAMLGHVCFDAAMETAARELKTQWAICGGYALSCLMRSTTPHDKYRYVEQIYSTVEGKVTEDLWVSPHGDGTDQTFSWGDVDFFLTNHSLHKHLAAGDDYSGDGTPVARGGTPAPWDWTPRKSRQAVRNAIAVITDCLTTVAGHGKKLGRAYDPACFFNADMLDRGYFGGVRNFNIEHSLLGRAQSIQLIISTDPEPDALTTVLGFDMTQCAVWVDEFALKQGEPEVTLALPCEEWKQAALQRKGYMRTVPGGRAKRAMLQKRRSRRLKYRARGFTVTLVSGKRLRDAQRLSLEPVHVRLALA